MTAVTVQGTVKALMVKGLDFPEAIKEVEHKLKGRLPESILEVIKREVNYGRFD